MCFELDAEILGVKIFKFLLYSLQSLNGCFQVFHNLFHDIAGNLFCRHDAFKPIEESRVADSADKHNESTITNTLLHTHMWMDESSSFD